MTERCEHYNFAFGGCTTTARFLAYYNSQAAGRRACSKHLARAVRDVAAQGAKTMHSSVVVLVRLLGGAS